MCGQRGGAEAIFILAWGTGGCEASFPNVSPFCIQPVAQFKSAFGAFRGANSWFACHARLFHDEGGLEKD